MTISNKKFLSKFFVQNPQQIFIQTLAIILISAPAIWLLVSLVKFSVNVPWWDQLSFVDLMTKLDRGDLSVYDLWRQHNEHRIFVPQAVELAVGSITRFNFRVQVMLNFFTAVTSFGLLMILLKRTFQKNRVWLILAIPISWLFFSPIQWTNWIWGFELVFFLGVFFFVFTIYSLTTNHSSWLFCLSIISASFATYSVGNGLLVWPIGLAIILWKHTDRKLIVFWCVSGFTVIASYLIKFQRSPESPPTSIIIRDPINVIKYSFANLGRNLALTPITARYVGATLVLVLLISTFYVYKKDNIDKIVAWLGIATFAFLTAILAATSRMNYGRDHGFISNSYPTISLLFIVATIVISSYALMLFLKHFRKSKMPIYVSIIMIFGGLCALSLPAFFKNYSVGAENLKGLSQHLHSVQYCVYHAQSADDNCLLKMYPNKEQAWDHIQQLKKLHWGDFK